MLGRIEDGAEACRKIEEEYRKNPAPGLDTLMKWLRTLMMDMVLKDKDDRNALKLVASLLRPVLEHTRLGIQQEALALHRAKYQRQTCELFLKWYADQRVREIAESPDDTDAKTEILGRLMFGEVWDD